ncbi:MAG: exodeoxyribonuclease V subunit gamma [Desulfopila sp.]
MLYLHVSNRTENLLRHLAEVLAASGRRNLFAREILLIQSQGMERMISQYLAERFGSWCNFEYFLPLGFLQYCARLLGMEVTPDGFDRQVVAWRLEALLRDIEGADYGPLRHYLAGDSLGLKRYQLAGQLANVFDQYQLMRPAMLTAWQAGRLVTAHPHERWQMRLWQRLQSDRPGARHRGEVLQGIIERLQTPAELSAILPERVSVFGLSIMPPLFLHSLQGLGRHCDVHLYVLSPCREYWGDLESRRHLLLAAKTDDAGEEAWEMPERHPLLVAFGRQGRDFQRMLFDDAIHFQMEFSSYDDPFTPERPTLLHRLQADLLAGRLTPASDSWPERDRSVQIVSCHSRLREIAVVKEHILHWLYSEPELQLRDIVVMAPDIQEYAPLIPAVFDTIQHSISDRSLRRRNTTLAVFVDFLSLFRGRFAWNEVLELIQQPTIAKTLALGPADLDNLQRWVIESGIRWGLSAGQRRESGLADFAEGSWRTGIDRLLMGYGIDSDQAVGDILPYRHIEGQSAVALGGLCRFLALVEAAREEFRQCHTLGQWAELLSGYAETLFADATRVGESGDFQDLLQLLTELGQTGEIFHHGPVDFEVILAWLVDITQETRSSSGFLRGQLTFCSMLPMRSIPFKKVCLLGLNDGAFPRNDRHATFDLLALVHLPGDRSHRMDDRYQFLEAIMAAREQLYISYIGQSITTNEELPPSVVVTELLEVLDNGYRAQDLVVRHPLQPFCSRYFTGLEDGLFSYEEKYCQLARRLLVPGGERLDWWRGVRQIDCQEIEIRELFGFYRNPQRFFVRTCLGVRLDNGVEVVPDSEPFAQERLADYAVNHELIEQLLTGKDPAALQRRLQAESRWPLGAPGETIFCQRLAEMEDFVARLEQMGLGARQADLAIDLRVDGRHLLGRLTSIHQGGILLYRYATLDARDLLAGRLHQLLYRRQTGQAVPVVICGRDRMVSFVADGPAEPTLELLVTTFVEGLRAPSPLYLGPGLELLKKEDVVDGLAAAQAALDRYLQQGWDAETQLLLAGQPLTAVLGESFIEATRAILVPVVDMACGW